MSDIYKNIFLYSIYISYILYFLALFGITNYAPKYLDYLKTFLKVYVGLVLIIFYNPLTYKKRQFTEFDRKIAFSSGLFLLLSTSIIGSFEKSLQEKTKEFVKTNIIDYFEF